MNDLPQRSLDGMPLQVCEYMFGTERVVKCGGVLHVSRDWWDTIKDGTDEQRKALMQSKVIDMDGTDFRFGGGGRTSITFSSIGGKW